MKTQILCIIAYFLLPAHLFAQQVDIPQFPDENHPRLLTNNLTGKKEFLDLIRNQNWAKSTFENISKQVDSDLKRYKTDSTWLVSRLQMYWNSHFTDVNIQNGAFVNGSGKAPIPTVRFTGTRDAASMYLRPKLEDVKPYMDLDGKIFLQSKQGSQQWEWVEQAKTGRIVESINIEILKKARDAAMLYWVSGEQIYAEFAYDIFDAYISGMYYRNEPVDLNHGHDQTLVGLTSFEVIHEDIIEPVTICYDFLFKYIKTRHPEKIDHYSVCLKKWADIIIKNGVPFNNWNLIEARFVAMIAIVLENDSVYPDRRGAQYYLDAIINKTSTRQWALADLFKTGYDRHHSIWFESPGYATGVLADFTGFVSLFDRTLGVDMMPKFPNLDKAVLASAQYLFPNGSIVGFGDTHYGPLRTEPIEDMIRNARRYKKTEQEKTFSQMLSTIRAFDKKKSPENLSGVMGFSELFNNKPLTINKSIGSLPLSDFLTPTYWSQNVSWFVQRNGLNPESGMMISQAGSTGNHAHSNGIAMELYAKGYNLAPESGIGSSYFQNDYSEYYSQFPAHNTVVVDGISSYPVMKSNHGIDLISCYPKPGSRYYNFDGITFSSLNFLEPETNAIQNRLMSIVRINDSLGYFVDIFRSKKKYGGDKYHDYIYHNLGQSLSITDGFNRPLDLKKTDKLTFAHQELMGYDYWYNKKSILTDYDFNARFDLNLGPNKHISMNVWMKGDKDREVFSVSAPPSRVWRKGQLIADSIANLPLPTLVVRQSGAAWNRPFFAIYEPADGKESHIKHISSLDPLMTKCDSTFSGVKVETASGIKDFILTAANAGVNVFSDICFDGSYAVIRMKDELLTSLFLGNGLLVCKNGYGLSAEASSSAVLRFEKGKIYFESEGSVSILIPHCNSEKPVKLTYVHSGKKIMTDGIGKTIQGLKVVAFKMGPMSLTEIELSD
ncbi:heparinase II/III family protein [Pedobacter frigidisoli]|uniref:heparinase II/III domain-containing protein n=1 Tax=Pedobacter frigidisoli TaxID=2530455 RepID=UPI002930B883|nr:heparinase II/III family protein [Pedobacter frigidisoli]